MKTIPSKVANQKIAFRQEFFGGETRTRIIPSFQLLDSFFVSRDMFVPDVFEFQPLTLGRFIKAIIYNSVAELKYNITRWLWLHGMLNTKEGYEVDFLKDWQWNFRWTR